MSASHSKITTTVHGRVKNPLTATIINSALNDAMHTIIVTALLMYGVHCKHTTSEEPSAFSSVEIPNDTWDASQLSMQTD